jgi:hypothetical protein
MLAASALDRGEEGTLLTPVPDKAAPTRPPQPPRVACAERPCRNSRRIPGASWRLIAWQLGGVAPPVDTSPDNATARVWTHRRGVEAAAGNEASRIVPTDALRPRLASRSGLIEGKNSRDRRLKSAVSDRPPDRPSQRTPVTHGEQTQADQKGGVPDHMCVPLFEIPLVLGGLRSGMLGQATHVAGVLLGLAAVGRLSITAT